MTLKLKFYVELVVKVEKCRINQDLNDENLTNRGREVDKREDWKKLQKLISSEGGGGVGRLLDT